MGSIIEPGQNVPVSGSVTGLGEATLWVVTKPDIGDGVYYMTQDGPVTERDGNWSFIDIQVGDDGDRGFNITYYVLQADQACGNALTGVPRNEDGLRTFPILFEGCEILAERPVTVTR